MGLIGDVLGFASKEREMNFEAHQAATNRQYQTEMSNTAVQRKMADMRAGGINPILAAGSGGMSGGASTPPGAKGSGASMTSQTSAVALMRELAQIKVLKEQEKNVRTDTFKKRQEGDLTKVKKILELNRVPGSKTEADIDQGYYGKAMRFINRFPIPLVPKLVPRRGR